VGVKHIAEKKMWGVVKGVKNYHGGGVVGKKTERPSLPEAGFWEEKI